MKVLFFLFAALLLLAGSKEEMLIAHTVKSIENARKEVSQLDPKVLYIDGMSSPLIRHFLNNLCSLKNSAYLEIGCWQGSTLVSACYKNQANLVDVVAIDNWSEYGTVKVDFYKNCERFLKNIPVRFFEADCFSIDTSLIFQKPVNIYFYDGEHTLSSHKNAFTYFNSVFDDVFIAVVDDWNWEAVREGTQLAFQELEYKILFEKAFFTKKHHDDNSWWNGLYIAVIKKK